MKIADIEVSLLGSYGDDDTVANAARVSFHKKAENYPPEQNKKLISYLAKHKHFSPFNHAFLSFRVKAPIFVARQLVKHKFLPWNEVSRRYVDEEPEFFMPTVYRQRADNVKQGSKEEADLTILGAEEHIENQLAAYNHMLDVGMCPEQARMFLPLNTMTEWVWSGTLGAFLDMLVLRLDPHTQKETQEVAGQIFGYCLQKFPVSTKARINQ